jgi:threonine/homoserine/homoserine lactone efflux protein
MPFDAATVFGHQLAAFTLGYVLVLLTPGPNLIVLAGIALVRGVRGSIPVCLGIAFGSVLLATAAALAADAVPESASWDAAGRALGGLLLLYVAWRLLSAAPLSPAAAAPLRVDFALGFGAALFNPITGAYFAAHFFAMRGARGLGDDVLIMALVGGITLLRSFAIAAVVGSLAMRTQGWRGGLWISRAAGAAFAAAAVWLLASAAMAPGGVLAALGT